MPAAEPLARARSLVERRDFPAAQQVLRDLLSRAHPDPADADAIEGDAAVLYAAVLMHLGEPHAARGWAGHGHLISERQYGEQDRRTLHALGVLAVSQHRVGSLGRAAQDYARLVGLLSAVEGPDSDRTLAARADAATVDHARGLCVSARAQLDEVIEEHELRHGPTHPLGIRMVARLAAMWRDCGRFDMAHDLLTRARSYADSTPHEQDTHRLLATASRAPANPEHRCGVEAVGTVDSATNAFPTVVVPGPDDMIPASTPNRQFTSISTAQEQEHQPVRGPHGAPPAAPPASAPMDWPEDEIFDRHPFEAATPGVDQQRQPGRPEVGDPNDHQPARPALTTLSPVPRSRLAGDTVSRTAPDAQQRLPVAVRQVPPKPGRSPVVVAVAAFAAVAAVAALTAAVLLARRDGPAATAAPTGSAVPQSPAPAADRAPVSGLALTDQGDTVLVTWRYPAAAEGPLVVSVSDAGQPMRPLQSLPAGTEQFTVRGLDAGRNYCVTITMAYHADLMVMATPVCTSRK